MTTTAAISTNPDIVELRERLATAPLIAFETLTNTAPTQVLGLAESVLKDGWRRPQHAALSLDGPMPWDEFAPRSRSWNFLLNCWDPLTELLSAYSSTGDRKYFQPALRVVLDWIERHAAYDTPGQGLHAWYDMAVGLRAYRLAYVFDAAARLSWVTDQEVSSLHESLELHRQALTDDTKIAFHSNHGFYQMAGLLAMARRFGQQLPTMRETLDQATTRLAAMLDRQFTPEGVHREHSPDYHRMVYETLKGIVQAGLLDDPAIVDRLDVIERALAWFVMPNGYLANFGDSDYRLCTLSKRAAGQRWRTPEMQFATSKGAVGAAPDAEHRAFPESGYFVVRTPSGPAVGQARAPGGSYLAQTAAFHSRTHKHADDSSFIWYDRGELWLVDAGRFGYFGKTEAGSEAWQDGFWYSDPSRIYCESTSAHNAVEIDGRNYARKGVKPYGSALKRSGSTANGVYYAESELRHFKSIRHVRLLVFKPGAWLLVCDWLHDNLEAEHDYRQWFHFAPELTVQARANQYVIGTPRLAGQLRLASLLSAPSPQAPILGRELPTRQGWWSPKESVMLPSYALSLEQRARSAVFATMLCFCDQLLPHASSRIAPSGRSGHLRWQADLATHELSFSRPEDGELVLEYEAEKVRT